MDFITPIVDDPESFGAIAAANALSDVFAMGGRPLVALNVVAFPTDCEPLSVLQTLLRGGAKKVMEAGACLAGGHSVQDQEPKYGLVVYGEVREEELWRVTGAQEGDVLLLTKPLGTGLLTTAAKAGLAAPAHLEEAAASMERLNQVPRVLSGDLRRRVHGCTDVTGFGLGGHGLDLVSEGTLDLILEAPSLPVLPGALEAASLGLIPAGAYANRGHAGERVRVEEGVDLVLQDLVFDPQTSGGLLLAVAPEDEGIFLEHLLRAGFPETRRVGRFLPGEGTLEIRTTI